LKALLDHLRAVRWVAQAVWASASLIQRSSMMSLEFT